MESRENRRKASCFCVIVGYRSLDFEPNAANAEDRLLAASIELKVYSRRDFGFRQRVLQQGRLGLLLLTGPRGEFSDLWVRLESFERVVVTTEVFFFGLEFVDCVVAVTAERDRFLHLIASEVFLEPLIAMASARDQVMFGGSLFRRSTAKQTIRQWLVHCVVNRCLGTGDFYSKEPRA